MDLIQRISSTLKTWVFKKKLLRFSDRFRWETQACFYCPEMCRFSCPVAETLREDTVTPRGKMSLLHLAERGFSDQAVAGSAEDREWVLEQCTGCGRCTEFCVYENDVGSHLRAERARYFQEGRGEGAGVGSNTGAAGAASILVKLSGTILLCERGRRDWWLGRPALLAEMGVKEVCDVSLPHLEWGWGKLSFSDTDRIGEAFSECSTIWVESPEVAWFLAKGLKEERGKLAGEVRLVWQKLFGAFAGVEFPPAVKVHESYHLTRLLPRIGYSIPMYERGVMPFHGGWNAWDCGGEGYFREAHPATAHDMGTRFLFDLGKDGRRIDKIVCQSLSCVSHLEGLTKARVTYWLDEAAEALA